MRMRSAYAAPLLCLAVSLLTLTAGFIDPERLGMRDNPYLSIIVLELLIYAVPAIFYCKLRPEVCTRQTLRIRFFAPDSILLVIFALGALVAGSCAIRAALYVAFPNVTETAAVYTDAFSGSVGGVLYSLLAFALLPALTEEFIFRSVLLAEYDGAGVLTSVVLSSALFAMMHMSLPLFAVYFYSGVVLAFTAIVTRSVLASMIVHACSNGVMLYGDVLIRRLAGRPGNTAIFLFISVALLLLFAALTFGEAQRLYGNRGVIAKPRPKRNKPDAKERAALLAETYFSPALLAFAVYYIVVSVASR